MPAPDGMTGLPALEAQVLRELAMTAHPRAEWVAPRLRGGAAMLDVLIVGAGQSGLAVGFALMRDRVTNILLIDRAPAGQEGPWVTYARMPTLRSPKDYNGPDLGLPSLTFQAWYEAQFGAAAWASLGLIPSGAWQAYLVWYRRVLGLPVRNGVALAHIGEGVDDQGARCLVATLDGGEVLAARKIVLATGQDGTGRWWMPDFIEALPARVRAHTCEAIDFAALRGRVVAVLGAGASAMDNAAMALEHGAEVHLFCRRPAPQVVQPYRWLTFAGFLKHIGEMPDEWRWRFMRRILGMREGFPPDTYRRVMAHAGFTMHVGRGWTGARMEPGPAERGPVVLETARGAFVADYVICGTGVRHDFTRRPELAPFADRIARWSDRYTPPIDEADAALGAFPYLGPDSALQERVAGTAPFLADIHLFTIGSTMSFGPSGSSINAMTTAAPRVAAGVTRGLFRADLVGHWNSLQAYDVEQVTLDWDRIATG